MLSRHEAEPPPCPPALGSLPQPEQVSSLMWTLLRKPRDVPLSEHCANRQWSEGKVGRGSPPHSYCHGDSSAPEILRPYVDIVLISFIAISARDASEKSHTATFSNALQRNKKGGKSCFPSITTNSSFIDSNLRERERQMSKEEKAQATAG